MGVRGGCLLFKPPATAPNTRHATPTHPHTQAEAQVEQSAATSSFEWRGQSHPVRHERVRVALHSARELAAALDAGSGSAMEVEDSEGGSGVEGRMAAFDKAINALGEARAAVRALIKANAGVCARALVL